MKKYGILALSLFLLGMGCAASDRIDVAAVSDRSPVSVRAPALPSCKDCHDHFSSLLSDGHPRVEESDLSSCTGCHRSTIPGSINPNSFSVRIHSSHLSPKVDAGCLACHVWEQGRYFGLPGIDRSWGAPEQEDMLIIKEIFGSWLSSEYLDHLHAGAFISCANCHGQLPTADATVEKQKCLECHGSMQELAKKTEPPDFKDRNPHQSHLGEIDCTVCHKAHGASKVYCLGCHKNFKIKIKGEGKPNDF